MPHPSADSMMNSLLGGGGSSSGSMGTNRMSSSQHRSILGLNSSTSSSSSRGGMQNGAKQGSSSSSRDYHSAGTSTRAEKVASSSSIRGTPQQQHFSSRPVPPLRLPWSKKTGNDPGSEIPSPKTLADHLVIEHVAGFVLKFGDAVEFRMRLHPECI
ncbi:unnamed protein product [Amoebophrya sp. A25]|nr:unnamed protein product [Amoebophrya sp. A25]|eukprot:GSA25T00013383001.1